jgi:hypothetical protein
MAVKSLKGRRFFSEFPNLFWKSHKNQPDDVMNDQPCLMM